MSDRRGTFSRRKFLAALGSAPLLGNRSALAATEWPQAKPITLVVPVSVGGVVDLVPRAMLPLVSGALGQSIVVENKPGADLAIGAAAVAKSAPDGYTLLAGSIPLTTNPVLKQVPYDPIADFETVSLLGTVSVMAVVPPALGVKTLAEFVALAKQKNGELNYANSATAGLVHINTELFAKAAGIRMHEILYKGQSPAMTDLLANRVNLMLLSPSTALGQVASGTLRPLAIAGAARSPLLPDVPTFAEAGFPSVNIESWIGIMAPAKTPQPIVARLNAAFNTALSSKDMIAQLAGMGVAAAPPSEPATLRRRMQEELAQWPKILDTAGIQREK